MNAPPSGSPRSVPPPAEPADFVAFWTTTFERATALPLRLARREIASPSASHRLFEIEYDSWDGIRVGAWILEPVGEPLARGVVVGHGYGGRDAPTLPLPGPPAVAVFPCARGFHRSAHPHIPSEASTHVLHGIEHRETYVHRGCVVDYALAASALLELHPAIAPSLDYQGGSFGGGIGALMLPWDARFRRAFLDVPSFGNHPLRVTIPCTGSGESVRMWHREHPEVLDILAYFDAATAARHIRIPTLVAAALSDPAVPPVGQIAVFEAVAGPKSLFTRTVSHPDDPRENDALFPILDHWFT